MDVFFVESSAVPIWNWSWVGRCPAIPSQTCWAFLGSMNQADNLDVIWSFKKPQANVRSETALLEWVSRRIYRTSLSFRVTMISMAFNKQFPDINQAIDIWQTDYSPIFTFYPLVNKKHVEHPPFPDHFLRFPSAFLHQHCFPPCGCGRFFPLCKACRAGRSRV